MKRSPQSGRSARGTAPDLQFKLLLPRALHDRIAAAAEQSGRSVSEEIRRRLEGSFGVEADKETRPLAEAIKLAAQKLDEMPRVGDQILVAQAHYEQIIRVEPPSISLDELMAAWKGVLERASQFRHHRISREELSVREHMSQILRRLKQDKLVEFTALFNVRTDGLSKLVVCFLAILELVREGLVRMTQQVAYSPIYLQISRD